MGLNKVDQSEEDGAEIDPILESTDNAMACTSSSFRRIYVAVTVLDCASGQGVDCE